MGIFGNLKKSFSDGSLMANLQSAGAISGGDYGTAAHIQGMHRKSLKDQQDEAAERQQREQIVAAAVQMGVPAEQAASLPTSALAGLVSQKYQPSPMVRDTQAWQNMTPQEQADYTAMMEARGGPLTMNLPGGGMYHGPASRLPEALGAGRAPPQGNIDAEPTSEDGYSYTPGPGGRANPANWRQSMSPDQAGQTMGAAFRSQTISREEAERVRQSLGPGGQAKFEQWMRDNNIQIGAR